MFDKANLVIIISTISTWQVKTFGLGSDKEIFEGIMKTILQIEGMSCDHCVQHVKEALESVAGVTSAKVSLKENSAAVEHEANMNLTALKAAVEEAGYKFKEQ